MRHMASVLGSLALLALLAIYYFVIKLLLQILSPYVNVILFLGLAVMAVPLAYEAYKVSAEAVRAKVWRYFVIGIAILGFLALSIWAVFEALRLIFEGVMMALACIVTSLGLLSVFISATGLIQGHLSSKRISEEMSQGFSNLREEMSQGFSNLQKVLEQILAELRMLRIRSGVRARRRRRRW